MNKVILIGRLGGDPEVRFSASGTAVCNFSLATSHKFKDKQGQQQEQTEWHKLVAFGRTAEVCGEYLKKGSQAAIEGRLQTRKWQDKETGADRYSTEIIVEHLEMLGSRPQQGQSNPAADNVKNAFPGSYDAPPIPDSDIPF